MSYSLMPQKLRALHPANGLRFSRRRIVSNALSKNSHLTNLKVSYYGAKGERLRLTSVKGELAFIQSDSRGDLWLPTWYVSKEAAK